MDNGLIDGIDSNDWSWMTDLVLGVGVGVYVGKAGSTILGASFLLHYDVIRQSIA